MEDDSCSCAAIAALTEAPLTSNRSLMRTVRTAKGPRHELVARLGKAPGLDVGKRLGWGLWDGLLTAGR